MFGLFAVALLAGSLAERVRRADVRLVRASEEIADLQFFNQYVIDNLVSGLATADEQNRLLTFNRSAAQITGHAAGDVPWAGRPPTCCSCRRSSSTVSSEDLPHTRSKRADVQYRRTAAASITLGLSVDATAAARSAAWAISTRFRT